MRYSNQVQRPCWSGCRLRGALSRIETDARLLVRRFKKNFFNTLPAKFVFLSRRKLRFPDITSAVYIKEKRNRKKQERKEKRTDLRIGRSRLIRDTVASTSIDVDLVSRFCKHSAMTWC